MITIDINRIHHSLSLCGGLLGGTKSGPNWRHAQIPSEIQIPSLRVSGHESDGPRHGMSLHCSPGVCFNGVLLVRCQGSRDWARETRRKMPDDGR